MIRMQEPKASVENHYGVRIREVLLLLSMANKPLCVNALDAMAYVLQNRKA